MFCDIKNTLSDQDIQQIIFCSLFDNSEKGIERALNKYPGEQFYGWIENNKTVAICGFRVIHGKVEICHIAVIENARRGRGIGGAMVSALRDKYKKYSEKVIDIVSRYNLETSVELRFIDLVSEIGELVKEILKGSKYGASNIKPTDNFDIEIGDIIFSLACIANTLNLDIENCLNTAIEKYKERLNKMGRIGSNED